jgi:hypothetical protein
MSSLMGLIDASWCLGGLMPWSSPDACDTYNSLLPFFWVLTLFFGLLWLYERASLVGVLQSNRYLHYFEMLVLVSTFGVPGFAILTIFFWHRHILPEGPNVCIMMGDSIMDWSMVGINSLLSIAYIVLFVIPVYQYIKGIKAATTISDSENSTHNNKMISSNQNTINDNNSSVTTNSTTRRLRNLANKNLMLSSFTILVTTLDMIFNAYGNSLAATRDPVIVVELNIFLKLKDKLN